MTRVPSVLRAVHLAATLAAAAPCQEHLADERHWAAVCKHMLGFGQWQAALRLPSTASVRLEVTVHAPLQGALALAFFADAHWQKRFPPDETGEARKLRRWIQHRMDVCKWVGLALLLLQVRTVAGH